MVLACGTPLVLFACDSQPQVKKGSSNPPSKAVQTPPPMTPVNASLLRERAIEIIEQNSVNPDASLRASATGAAAFVPGRLRPILEKGLQDTNSGVRGVTAMAIGRAQVKGFDDRLVPLLHDPEVITQVSATYALARTGGNVDRSPLASWLLNDPSPWVKRHAADVLGLLGDKSALPLLKAAAREKFSGISSEQMRILQLMLAEAMIRLGDDAQRPVIRAALYPSAPEELEVAALAVAMIGEVQDREASAQLVNIAEYKDSAGHAYPAEIRLAVAASLAKLGMTQGYFVADEYIANTSAVVRAQCAFVYGVTKGPENLAKLQRLMEDPEPLVRISAAAALLGSSAKP